jgi:7-cyano-7-deazaguanine synthase
MPKTQHNTPGKAIVLFSGGLDSTTCLALAKDQGFTPIALSFDYGQKQIAELQASQLIAQNMNVEHLCLPLTIPGAGASSLVNEQLKTPNYQESEAIPVTYVPARNLIFLSMATSLAEHLGAQAIFIGANAVDYSNYPDCRPEFIQAFSQAANLGTTFVTHRNLTIHTPLINLSKADIILLGTKLGVDYGQTVSCYNLNEAREACGQCDACHFRKRGFAQAALADPTRYQTPIAQT